MTDEVHDRTVVLHAIVISAVGGNVGDERVEI
jgi:hypothetical protein